jgi:protein-arginine kinase activator protein McsA
MSRISKKNGNGEIENTSEKTSLGIYKSIHCPKCLFEDGIETWNKKYSYDDSYIIEVNCKQGHQTYHVGRMIDYEYYFDKAIYNYDDENYFGAVASATVAIDCFYEFFNKIILRTVGFKSESNQQKYIRKNSVRRIGFFVGLYLLTFRKEPLIFLTDHEKLRNEVVHNGKIPSKTKTKEYIDYVLKIINTTLDELVIYEKEVEEYKDWIVSDRKKKILEKDPEAENENRIIIDHGSLYLTLVGYRGYPYEDYVKTMKGHADQIYSMKIPKNEK